MANLAKSKIKYFNTPIISGKYKGKNILIPAITTTRSSKSILRESLFNTISFDVVGCNFVELFAGSGSIGLEALSRGAKRSYFFENNYEAHKLLKENIKNIDEKNSIIYYGDAFELFDSLYTRLKEQNECAIFYFDPPFSIREDMEDIYDKCINLIAKIDDNFAKMVIVEHMSSLELPKNIANLEQFKFKKFGKSALSYYKLNE
jgi:16S rRNA (guanine(966)-N(2))-methyltransferase RsmD